jgi:GDP-L-fucose synthase
LFAENNEPFVVWGSGTPLRQFIYSEDLGALLVWTIHTYEELSPLILSVGEEDEVSIAFVAKQIAEQMNYTQGLKVFINFYKFYNFYLV